MAQPDLQQAVNKIHARLRLEEPTKGHFGHIGQPGRIGQLNGFIEVLIDVLDHFLHPLAVITGLALRKGCIRDQPGISGNGEIVENAHELQYGIEALPGLQIFQPAAQGQRCFLGEEDAAFGALEHLPDKMQLIPPQHLFIKEILMELDGDLMDLGAFTFVVLPGMRQVGTNKHQVYIINFLHNVADYTTGAFCIDHQVELQLFMVVQGEIELRFGPGKNGKAVTGGEGGNLLEHILL